MSTEQFPEIPKSLALGLPEGLNGRSELATKLDGHFELWDTFVNSRYVINQKIPAAATIIKDCRPPSLVDEENQRQAATHSRQRNMFLNSRANFTRAIAELANNAQLDRVQLTDKLSIFEFDSMFSWLEYQDASQEALLATLYLKRLYLARERLAMLSGNSDFDTTHLQKVALKIQEDENPVNGLHPL